jgi:hypothetical protein
MVFQSRRRCRELDASLTSIDALRGWLRWLRARRDNGGKFAGTAAASVEDIEIEIGWRQHKGMKDAPKGK